MPKPFNPKNANERSENTLGEVESAEKFEVSGSRVGEAFLRTWIRLFELKRYSRQIPHLCTSLPVAKLQTHGERYDFRWLEERMVPLGLRPNIGGRN